MKKKLTFVGTLLVLLLANQAVAQKLIDKEGKIHFFSEAPLENIEASNNQVIGALDLTTGNVAVSMLMKGFHFEKSLMEEHFNENYIESDKYPKSTFTGKIGPADLEKVKNLQSELKINIKGDLTLHGVTKTIDALVTFVKSGAQLQVSTEFIIKIEEYKIKVPSMLISNIAEEVATDAHFTFTLDQKP